MEFDTTTEQFWRSLGVPDASTFEKVEQVVSGFLTDRGYEPDQAWFEGCHHDVVKVGVKSAYQRLLVADSEDLEEAVKTVDARLELRILRRNSVRT